MMHKYIQNIVWVEKVKVNGNVLPSWVVAKNNISEIYILCTVLYQRLLV